MKEPLKLPPVLVSDEIKRVLACAESLKARVMLTLAYGCGLRAGEVVRLTAGDIDSEQMIIRVVQSKGHKDRHVMLPAEVLDLLRQWWKERPIEHDAGITSQRRWLFPGRGEHRPSHRPPVRPAVQGGSRSSRHQEVGDTAYAPSQLRDASARGGRRCPEDPGGSGPRQARDDSALYARGNWHDRGYREPARGAVLAESVRRAEKRKRKGRPPSR